jgi:hypothetical protein
MTLFLSNTRAWLAGLLAFTLLVLTTACSPAVITLIELGISAGEAIAAASGVPLPPAIMTYIAQAEQAFSITTATLATTETTLQKAQDIHNQLAALVLPDLTGLSAADQQKVKQIDSVVAQLLAEFPATLNAAQFSANVVVKMPAFKTPDIAKLRALSARAKAVPAALIKRQPKTIALTSSRPGPVAAIICSGKGFDSCFEATSNPVFANEMAYRYLHASQIKFQIAKLSW